MRLILNAKARNIFGEIASENTVKMQLKMDWKIRGKMLKLQRNLTSPNWPKHQRQRLNWLLAQKAEGGT